MTRKYAPDKLNPHAYHVPEGIGGHVVRPTRNAAGMTYTHARSRKSIMARPEPVALEGRKWDVLRLSTRGTLDVLTGHSFDRMPIKCTHCGGTGRVGWRLSDKSRWKLERMRRRFAERRGA